MGAGGRESKRRPASKEEDDASVPGLLVTLQRAEGLPSADSNGLSDPYCVFKVGKLSKHKSTVVYKSLNPEWQEEFFLPAPENTAVPLSIVVKDKDLIGSDDYLGEVHVDISTVSNDGTIVPFEVELTDKKGKVGRGRLFFTLKRTERGLNQVKGKEKVKKWAVASGDRKVIVEVIKGMDLLSMDSNGFSDPYLVMKLGKVKHTTRVVKRSLNPSWQQRFEFPLPVGTSPELKVQCWDRDLLSRDDAMGNVIINVDRLPAKVVTDEWYDLVLNNDKAGHIHLLITVLDDAPDLMLTKEQRAAMVGSLKVHVIKAEGLKSADMNGKSDPYVELQLGNSRLRTKTQYKTLDPLWDQLLELPVKDIFTCLELSVWDEDRGGKSKPDFLGKIIVPLLEIKNNDTRWYGLKSKDALRKGKGEIQLAFKFAYKQPKAYLGVIKRREPNYMESGGPFSMRRLLNAISRINAINAVAVDALIVAIELLKWERHPALSALACLGWVLFCLLFRLWMVPLILAISFGLSRLFVKPREIKIDERGLIVTDSKKNAAANALTGFDELGIDDDLDDDALFDDDEEDDDAAMQPEDEPEGNAPKSQAKKKPKRSRKGLMSQLTVLRQIGKKLQDALEFAATVQERVKNIAEWRVPLITSLVCFACGVATVVLLIVPWNLLLAVFGAWQFIKRGLRKYVWPRSKFHVPILELIEFLGRVPSDMDLVRRKQIFRPDEAKRISVKKSAKLISL